MSAGLVMPIANRVKERRLAAQMTQQALAGAAGLSLSVVAQIEQGLIPDPRASTLQALARSLGCSMDDLAPVDDPAPAAKKRGTGKPRK